MRSDFDSLYRPGWRKRRFGFTLGWTIAVLLATLGLRDSDAQSLPIQPALAYSSSVLEGSLPDLPLPRNTHADIARSPIPMGRSIRPFSVLAIGVTSGSGGIGVEFATPLADHLNLRTSGSYFSYYSQFTSDGLNVNGRMLARSINTSIDYFPFHNGFRISPGVTLDNGNAVHGVLSIAPGETFSLGDGTYTSAPGDPVHGNASISFGRRIAPSLTTGWGNLISRRRGHLTVPFEIGFQYIGAPLVNFNLEGTACDQFNDCGQIQSDPTSLANEQQQRDKINKDIYPLRFFPIVNIGFGWSF
jgi:hypothetical protein